MDGSTRPEGDVHALRVPALLERRDLKMARDAHAFVRGSTERFYEWLSTSAGRAIPEGPRIWICGDAHVGNLGPIARCDERVVIELRDLDQTVPGNPAHDLVRLGLSLAMAARSSVLPGVVTAQLMEELTAGYLEALMDPETTNPKSGGSVAVRFVLREAMKRRWRDLRRERLRRKPKFPYGRRFLRLSEEEQQAVSAFLSRERVRQLVTLLESRRDDARTRVLDAAFWVKGCSSLGLFRCAALIEVIGNDGPSRYSLLDLKEAAAPVAPLSPGESLPKSHGERVVRGAQALSPALGARMLWGEVMGRSVFVRELMPQDLKVELSMMSAGEARATARALSRVVGLAHARQLDEASRAQWRDQLEAATTRWLDAPSWLWSSVIELIGIHERAYLEHCRRYALRLEKERDVALA
jgi:uncharacterized protein (DUF2252 family)